MKKKLRASIKHTCMKHPTLFSLYMKHQRLHATRYLLQGYSSIRPRITLFAPSPKVIHSDSEQFSARTTGRDHASSPRKNKAKKNSHNDRCKYLSETLDPARVFGSAWVFQIGRSPLVLIHAHLNRWPTFIPAHGPHVESAHATRPTALRLWDCVARPSERPLGKVRGEIHHDVILAAQ